MLRQFPWRQLLALFLIFLVFTCLWAEAQQDRLAEEVIRLHVLANSDSAEDQALKLAVRDRVLEEARPLLASAVDAREAASVLRSHLGYLAYHAGNEIRSQGYRYPVTVALEDTWFPTRVYDNAALPAGTYQALRVVIGSGEGHNWWCVVFPSLCLPAVSESSLQTAVLSKGEVGLVTQDTPGYVFRFKTVELWETLKHTLSGPQK